MEWGCRVGGCKERGWRAGMASEEGEREWRGTSRGGEEEGECTHLLSVLLCLGSVALPLPLKCLLLVFGSPLIRANFVAMGANWSWMSLVVVSVGMGGILVVVGEFVDESRHVV